MTHNSATKPEPQSASSDTMARRDLTLIVAATNQMGIGLKGALPWTGLKKEMAYFARVTKRTASAPNAVIMGRKTWDSIPPKFRPLKDRLNIVITTDISAHSAAKFEGAERADSIASAVQSLAKSTLPRRVFVIGGAQIYKAAMAMEETRKILLTRVHSDFDCDAFFPVKLGEDGKGEGWERMKEEELDRWIGENVPEGVQEENGTRYNFEMWERVD